MFDFILQQQQNKKKGNAAAAAAAVSFKFNFKEIHLQSPSPPNSLLMLWSRITGPLPSSPEASELRD